MQPTSCSNVLYNISVNRRNRSAGGLEVDGLVRNYGTPCTEATRPPAALGKTTSYKPYTLNADIVGDYWGNHTTQGIHPKLMVDGAGARDSRPWPTYHTKCCSSESTVHLQHTLPLHTVITYCHYILPLHTANTYYHYTLPLHTAHRHTAIYTIPLA